MPPERPSVEEVRWENQRLWNDRVDRELREIKHALDGLKAKIMWSCGFAAAVAGFCGAFLGVLMKSL